MINPKLFASEYKTKSGCLDIDDCATGIHNCDVNGICKNQIGSFTCTCSELYRDVSDETGHKCKGNGLHKLS